MRAIFGTRGALFTALMLNANSVLAAEQWSCEYEPYRHGMPTQVSSFRVEGKQLVQYSGDTIVNYQLVEDSKTAIIAASGAAYVFEPTVVGFLIMIRKDTGAFVLATASNGDTNGRQIGTCRILSKSGH